VNSFLNRTKYKVVDATIAATARHPKCPNMNVESQAHGRATMSTGGAAKCVSVPPIETLTKSRPSVAYFSGELGLRSKN
jgi:hypothetical protein